MGGVPLPATTQVSQQGFPIEVVTLEQRYEVEDDR
jgi:hypothetical protein